MVTSVAAPSLVLLLSASVLRVCNEPLGWLLLSFEAAGKDGEVDMVRRGGGQVEEGRVRQQSTRDDADALFLVCLLLAPVLCARWSREIGRR